jgi:hypothetical protein
MRGSAFPKVSFSLFSVWLAWEGKERFEFYDFSSALEPDVVEE